MYIYISEYMYVHHIRAVPAEVRRSRQIPWNWNYRQLGLNQYRHCKQNPGLLQDGQAALTV